MVIWLYEWLKDLDIPGWGMLQYISFRSSAAIILSLFITMGFGKKLIDILRRRQIGEDIRDLGLEGQMKKKGTPTMGGLIIIISIVLPVLLFARLNNVYIILMLVTTIWLGLIGFIDDYIKVFLKDKQGLAGRFKILGQVSLGLIVASTLYFSDDMVVRESLRGSTGEVIVAEASADISGQHKAEGMPKGVKTTTTTLPFVKNHEFDYAWIVSFTGKKATDYLRWIVYGLAIILIITAVSNSANLTDGIDGLATGVSAISGATLGILAYVSGNVIYAAYLNIMYLPNVGELTVFMAAFIGATVGFLWFNSHPAQVFMGDTGSLALGGIIAVFAILIKKEILLPLLCGIFLIETLSVVIQVSYFKYTRRKTGEGRRIFLMSPIHHHFQKKGLPEAKIVTRFWIVGIILAVITIATLKMR